MDKTGEILLKLMFREGEQICVSPNKYGYHSVEIPHALQSEVPLLSTKFRDGIALEDGTVKMPSVEESMRTVPGDELQLVSLNPIKGWREDQNCTAYRNFLVECDYGTTQQQLTYIRDQHKMPYSAAIFSGGKSVHFLISLSADLPTEESWRAISEWILGIVTLADPMCKNPSRSIRIPGAKRDDKRQQLLEYRGPVTLSDLHAWLALTPTAAPKPKEKFEPSGIPNDLSRLSKWVKRALATGLDPKKGRNQQWFAIACDFAIAGFSEEDCIIALKAYFRPDRDFKEREFLTSVRSAFKHVYVNGKTR